MWPVFAVYMTITSFKEVMKVIIKDPLSFFPPAYRNGTTAMNTTL